MADPVQTTPLENELYDFCQDFISPKRLWRNSHTSREREYSSLKRKFDKYQKNDTLIQCLKGRYPLLLQSVVKNHYHHVKNHYHHGFWERLKVLLESRAFDIDVPDSDRRTAFSHAAEFYDTASMRLLLEHNANPNSKDKNGWTPLMWMAKSTYNFTNLDLITLKDNVMDFMRTKGADISCQDTNGQTALMLAAQGMKYDLINIFIGKKADAGKTDLDGHTWFWWLLKSRQQSKPRKQYIDSDDPVFRTVLGIDSSPKDTGGRTLLSWAVEFQDMAMVKALLDGIADADDYDENPPDPVLGIPFLRALESNNIALASLFTNKILYNLKFYPVGYAKKDHHSLHTLVKRLDNIGEERALNLLQKMSEVSYNINQRDNTGSTPLHEAIVWRKESFALEILQQLKQNDLNVMDNEGKSPLFFAINNKMTNVVRGLVRNGANIDLSLDWSQLGTGYIRFTLETHGTEFEFMNEPPNEEDCIPSAEKTILCSYGKDNWPLRSMPITTYQYKYLDCTRMIFGQGERTVSQIAAFFPQKENRFELGDFWAIGRGTNAKQFGLATTIPSAIAPQSWGSLCKQLVGQLLRSWESLCDEKSREIEDIREEQLKKQGKSGLIVKRLAENTLNRVELRRCHQQHVSGLVRAFKSDANLGRRDEIDPIASVDQLKESVEARLDQLEQASKELLQIEFAWVSISEAASIKRISLVTFIFLPLMFASSLFGMNVDVLANNPDWRWYVVIGASSLILTLVIWIVFRFFPIEHWVEDSRRWASTFWGKTLRMNKPRMDIKTRWSRRQQKIPDAEMSDTELKV